MLLNQKHFGLIIWGIRNGWENQILISDKNEEVSSFIKDIRQICNDSSEEFFSIEKTSNFTLITIYNPNTTDITGSRDAFIAITIFLQNRLSFESPILPVLKELMNRYIEKQNGKFVNQFTPDYFFDYLKNAVHVKQLNNYLPQNRDKLGFKIYNNLNEIEIDFSELTINRFKKIFFFSKPNKTIESDNAFIEVKDIPKLITLTFLNYNSGYHKIYVNQELKQINPGNSQIEIIVNENDNIKIGNVDSHSFYEESIKATKSETWNLRSPQKKIKKLEDDFEKGYIKPKKKKKKIGPIRIVLIIILFSVAVFYGIRYINRPGITAVELTSTDTSLINQDTGEIQKPKKTTDSLINGGASKLLLDPNNRTLNNKYIRIRNNQWQYNNTNEEGSYKKVESQTEYDYLNNRFNKKLTIKSTTPKKTNTNLGAVTEKKEKREVKSCDICNEISTYISNYESTYLNILKDKKSNDYINFNHQFQVLKVKYNKIEWAEDHECNCSKEFTKISNWNKPREK